ncbi:MAG: class I SAM-dependent methyltransferase [Thermomicrobiales bacterium]|nr:class I SAM-dependent methyltransferase [Thermomicrobiales bacterium]MCO5217739.1 class I SAM-dependent methyltransferase [Thermomicrobiales bacterium]MCO5225985.1 class I SAM-dependent methyltransferase [Thermomicrobiales bacterium]MCO5228610.1 class I SAM-dependent methyltransferase [Thermomicrobiales bacterium]
MESPFNQAAEFSTEHSRLEAIYDIWNESDRLTSRATQIEFRTTLRVITEAVPTGASVLDLGAGTGRYAEALAILGYRVTAVEPVTKHVEEMRANLASMPNLTIVHDDAISYLTTTADNTFDTVLCLGPLYHIESDTDRLRCVEESKRVCTMEGTLFFAFVTNDMVILTQELNDNPGFILSDEYNHETFRIDPFPLVFHNIDDACELIERGGITVTRKIASDGISELVRDRINNMDERSYEQWFAFHTYCCEKPEFLGTTNHLLLVGVPTTSP